MGMRLESTATSLPKNQKAQFLRLSYVGRICARSFTNFVADFLALGSSGCRAGTNYW